MYTPNPNASLNGTSSYETILKTHDTNPSTTRIRHPTDSSYLPSHTDTSHIRHPKSYYQLGQQSRKDYRLFLSPFKVLKK